MRLTLNLKILMSNRMIQDSAYIWWKFQKIVKVWCNDNKMLFCNTSQSVGLTKNWKFLAAKSSKSHRYYQAINGMYKPKSRKKTNKKPILTSQEIFAISCFEVHKVFAFIS